MLCYLTLISPHNRVTPQAYIVFLMCTVLICVVFLYPVLGEYFFKCKRISNFIMQKVENEISKPISTSPCWPCTAHSAGRAMAPSWCGATCSISAVCVRIALLMCEDSLVPFYQKLSFGEEGQCDITAGHLTFTEMVYPVKGHTAQQRLKNYVLKKKEKRTQVGLRNYLAVYLAGGRGGGWGAATFLHFVKALSHRQYFL